MEERTVRGLQFLTLQVVGAVAVIHFVVAVEQLSGIVANGLLGDYLTRMVFVHPRAFLFFVSSVAIGVGIVATARGILSRRRAYLLGILALVTYLLGWVAWHTVLQHGLALTAAAPTEPPHSHGGVLGTLVSHYLEPLWAVVVASTADRPGTAKTFLGIVSKTLELLGVVLLAVLLRVDPEAEAPAGGFSLGLENPEGK